MPFSGCWEDSAPRRGSRSRVFAAYAAIPLGLLALRARDLDLLALGEEPAQHLGADVQRSMRDGLRLHRAAHRRERRRLRHHRIRRSGRAPRGAHRLRPIHRTLLPLVFLAGGCFLVLCDIVSRVAVRPLELPVGVITALVGVPIFALLLRRTLA